MSEDRLDRFARGELTTPEERELARKALDDPELFDELTYIAAASAAFPKGKPRRDLRPAIAFLAAAAAIAVAVWLYRPAAAPAPSSPPVTASAAPVFLARNGETGASFRGAETESRDPRAAGSVTSVEGGLANIDLGSLDGLERGSELEVLRDGNAIGKIKVTVVFRERARGEAASGTKVRPGDQIRVPGELHERALLDQIASASARGDAGAARRLADEAARDGDAPVSAAEYQDLNNLGGIAELRGDRSKAESLYEEALRAGPPAEARRTIEMNLARVKGGK